MISEEYAKLMAKHVETLASLTATIEPHKERIMADNLDTARLMEITDGLAWHVMLKGGVSIERHEDVLTFMLMVSLLAYQMGYLRGEGKENIFERMVVRDVAGE